MTDPIPFDDAKKFRDKMGPGYVQFESSNVAVANQGFKSQRLRYADLATMSSDDIPERRWIVNEWMPEGYVHLLSGDGGVGKSLLAQQLMTCAASGMNWMGKQVRKCRTIGIFCEDDDDELRRRQVAINAQMGIDFFDIAESMTWVSRIAEENNAMIEFPNQWDPGQATVFFQQIHNLAQDFGAELIVLDSLHDLFPGNENNRVQTRQFVKLLTGIARDCSGAVVLCSHPSASGKANGQGFSGSTAWHNSVRSRAYLTRPEEPDADANMRTLTNKKANYGAMGGKIDLLWKDGAFVHVEEPIGAFKGMEERRVDRLFLDALDRATLQSRVISASSNAANYAPRAFVDLIAPEERVTFKMLATALSRLLYRGIVTVDRVKFPNSARAREGLVRVEATAPLL